eukprot:EG_transcript_14640
MLTLELPASQTQCLTPSPERMAKLIQLLNSSDFLVHYEDDYCAIVHKPSGVHTMQYQNTLKRSMLTMADVVPLLLRPSPAADCLGVPLPRHRLDMRVSGPVLIAKTQTANAAIQHAFEERRVEKEYRAIVVGLVEADHLTIDTPLDGKPCLTELRVLHRTPSAQGGLTTVRLWPHTGRQHQLRLHCAALGHPIVGDDLHCSPSDQPAADAVTSGGEAGPATADAALTPADPAPTAAPAPRPPPRYRNRGLFLQCIRLALPHPVLPDVRLAAEEAELPRFEQLRLRAASGFSFLQTSTDCPPTDPAGSENGSASNGSGDEC